MDYTVIVYLVCAVVGVAVYWVYDRLRNYTKDEWAQEDMLRFFVKTAVSAAEQLFVNNDEKLTYVLGIVKKRFPSIDIDIARMWIESAVREMKDRNVKGS